MQGGARPIPDRGDDLLACRKCLSHGAISRVSALTHMHMCTANNTHAHSHFPFSLCLPLSFAHILWGIYGDVKAVIGQVSGVELSDNRLVTVAAHE